MAVTKFPIVEPEDSLPSTVLLLVGDPAGPVEPVIGHPLPEDVVDDAAGLEIFLDVLPGEVTGQSPHPHHAPRLPPRDPHHLLTPLCCGLCRRAMSFNILMTISICKLSSNILSTEEESGKSNFSVVYTRVGRTADSRELVGAITGLY